MTFFEIGTWKRNRVIARFRRHAFTSRKNDYFFIDIVFIDLLFELMSLNIVFYTASLWGFIKMRSVEIAKTRLILT